MAVKISGVGIFAIGLVIVGLIVLIGFLIHGDIPTLKKCPTTICPAAPACPEAPACPTCEECPVCEKCETCEKPVDCPATPACPTCECPDVTINLNNPLSSASGTTTISSTPITGTTTGSTSTGTTSGSTSTGTTTGSSSGSTSTGTTTGSSSGSTSTGTTTGSSTGTTTGSSAAAAKLYQLSKAIVLSTNSKYTDVDKSIYSPYTPIRNKQSDGSVLDKLSTSSQSSSVANLAKLGAMDCSAPSQGLRGFNFARVGDSNMKYEYGCGIGGIFEDTKSFNTDFVSFKGIDSLSALKADCVSQGGVLDSLNYILNPEKNKLGYEYTCKRTSVPLNIRTLITPATDIGDGNVKYLDGQAVQCDENEMLASVQMNIIGNQMMYIYQCASNSGTGTQIHNAYAGLSLKTGLASYTAPSLIYFARRDKYYYLKVQEDGNLVLYQMQPSANVSTVIWSSLTSSTSKSSYHLNLQSDGNIVLYKGSDAKSPVWKTGTDFLKASPVLNCDNNGILFIHLEGNMNRIFWNSRTGVDATGITNACPSWDPNIGNRLALDLDIPSASVNGQTPNYFTTIPSVVGSTKTIGSAEARSQNDVFPTYK
jgi:hypothetical protein